jgi:hypothetical protein
MTCQANPSPYIPLLIDAKYCPLKSHPNRSASWSATISWILVLISAILLNIKLYYPDEVTYLDIFIPTFVIFAYWIIMCLYTLLLYACGVYRLKVS